MKMKKNEGVAERGIDLVEFFIDDTLLHSKNWRRRHERVSRAQEALRKVADETSWRAFLDVESTMNDRAANEMRLVFNRLLAVFAYATSGSVNRRSRR